MLLLLPLLLVSLPPDGVPTGQVVQAYDTYAEEGSEKPSGDIGHENYREPDGYGDELGLLAARRRLEHSDGIEADLYYAKDDRADGEYSNDRA